jgi:hypothetical protein
MKDPVRIAREGTSFESALLRASAYDGPTAEERARLLASIGVGTGLSLAMASAAKVKVFSWSLVIKGGLAVGVGTVVLAVGFSQWNAARNRPFVPSVTSQATGVAPVPVQTETTTEPDERGVDIATLPRSPLVRANNAKATTAPFVEAAPVESQTAPPKVKSTLRDDIEHIDAIRSEIAAGRQAEALEKILEYEMRGGALADEALALKVEVLVKLGRKPEAEKIAAAFLQAHPQSALAPRIRTLLTPKTSIP